MTYETAPATKLLAAHCAVCSRPLVDAISVETGMGPECRRRHGYDAPASDEARREVNRRVYLIALWRTHAKQLVLGDQRVPTTREVVEHVMEIQKLGFTKLAGVLGAKLADVELTRAGDVYSLAVPYDLRFITALRSARSMGRPCAHWNEPTKTWTFAAAVKNQVYAALRVAFAGRLGTGPLGLFVIG